MSDVFISIRVCRGFCIAVLISSECAFEEYLLDDRLVS